MRIASNPMKKSLRLIKGNKAASAADPVGSRIRDFLAGSNDGGELFAALYSHIGREPIPERLCRAAGLASAPESVTGLVNLVG